jgi:hypothetical protein
MLQRKEGEALSTPAASERNYKKKIKKMMGAGEFVLQ